VRARGPRPTSKPFDPGSHRPDRLAPWADYGAAPESELPPDDLLKHIHRQTTLLYSREHSGGLGRRLLDEAAWEAYSLRRRKRRPTPPPRSEDGSRSGTDDEGEDELDSSDDDDGAGSDRTMGSRRSSRSGRSLGRQTSQASVLSAGQEDGVAAKKRGGPRDTRKNMYKALTGDTLIALGKCHLAGGRCRFKSSSR